MMKAEEVLEKLKRERDEAAKKLDYARDSITMHEYAYFKGRCMERQLKVCINEFDNVINFDTGNKFPGLVLHCEHFSGRFQCSHKECEYNKNNAEYINALEEYKDKDSKYNGCSLAIYMKSLQDQQEK